MPQICEMGQAFTSAPKEGVLRIFFHPAKSDDFGWV
jgi:hypothetical protein